MQNVASALICITTRINDRNYSSRAYRSPLAFDHRCLRSVSRIFWDHQVSSSEVNCTVIGKHNKSLDELVVQNRSQWCRCIFSLYLLLDLEFHIYFIIPISQVYSLFSNHIFDVQSSLPSLILLLILFWLVFKPHIHWWLNFKRLVSLLQY